MPTNYLKDNALAELPTPIAYDKLSQIILKAGHTALLSGIRHGIEKEGLRVDSAAVIAQTPHPECLGSALSHPHITTDYSESLLELITKPYTSHQDTLNELLNIHRWIYHCMHQEIIWPGSMPCKLQGEKSIPIAQYGNSNIGTMKHVYRHGLGWRYGRIMQSIAGIHYNFSLPQNWWDTLYKQSDKSTSKQDFISAGYIALIRNFRRHAWLLSYLFGASPALDISFLDGKTHKLDQLDKDTLYLPHATCLRMTDLGYKSSAQKNIRICYNHLSTYINSVQQALNSEYKEYETIGIKVKGEYRQLNTKLLQIENEFYSEIRPKRTPQNGEKPLTALTQQGIEYIEVRLLDINPFLPLGLDKPQMQFIDNFLIHCLLSESPTINAQEYNQIDENLYMVAQQGRKPKLKITVTGQTASVVELAQQYINDMASSAALLDQANNCTEYSAALQAQQNKLDNSDLLPSQQLLKHMEKQGKSYTNSLLELAQQHQDELQQELINNQTQTFKNMSIISRQRQTEIEAQDNLSFDDFLAEYFTQPATIQSKQ